MDTVFLVNHKEIKGEEFSSPHHNNLARISSLTKMLLFPFLLLTSFTVLIDYSSQDKCDQAAPCTSMEDWRENLLCRLEGGLPDTTQRQNGYIIWATNQTSAESNNGRARRTRYDAARNFFNAVQDLNNFANTRPRDRQRLLDRIEKDINDWGTRLARDAPSAGTWQTDDNNRCGILVVAGTNGGRNNGTTPCGNRPAGNEPNCPIRPSDNPNFTTTIDPNAPTTLPPPPPPGT